MFLSADESNDSIPYLFTARSTSKPEDTDDPYLQMDDEITDANTDSPYLDMNNEDPYLQMPDPGGESPYLQMNQEDPYLQLGDPNSNSPRLPLKSKQKGNIKL